MAADPDPYFALPKLYGAPAYARPPRVVAESERPIDPDDLPIAAERTEEERALAAVVLGPPAYHPTDYRSVDYPAAAGPSPVPGASGANGNGANGNGANGSGANGTGASGSTASGGGGVIGRRFSLRSLGGRRDTAAK